MKESYHCFILKKIEKAGVFLLEGFTINQLKVAYAEVDKMSRTVFTFTACSIRGSDSSLREITFSYSTKAAV
ncbi:hypothetical protein ABEW72_10790 [Bacillus velezensis]|uniref:hypothetical protein n=1 Tax=Bacillus velezensis TaxID=492670 RepID=UPI00218AC3BF|nr:hypothetical protein [Bacillus velezensis]MDQ9147758.1 hypothetical protein [Bacillus velezensis]MEC2187390.1 hypothetical protein [Bacillus velezensis]URM43278.1 hypothetical protein D9R10_02310 [Bacillus velezensis]